MRRNTIALAIGGTLIVAALALGATVHAGAKNTQTVTVNTASRNAFGSLGSARNSANTVEFIGCYTNQAGVTGCSARNAANTFINCTTTDANFRSAVNSLNGDSRIYFEWNTANTCTVIQVENYSSWAPKNP